MDPTLPPTEVLWLTGGKVERHPATAGAIEALLARDDGVLWMDIADCDDATAELLTEAFGFHPLAVRDCRARSPIPLGRGYDDHVFFVLHSVGAGEGGRARPIELDYFAGLRYVVTVHGPVEAGVAETCALDETNAVRQRIESGKFAPRTSPELVHAIVSAVARRQEEFVSRLAGRIADLERHVLAGEAGDIEATLEELFRVRHELLTVRTLAAACRESYARMAALARFLPPEARALLEDLVDQFDRVRRVCDGQKEFLQGIVDFYQSRATTKINIAMERLALISAVILPITAIAGIYGMNIIVGEKTDLVHLAGVLAAMGVVAALMLGWAKRQGWW